MIVKRLIFFGRPATHACDGRCDKAWGRNNRPSMQVSDDVDDYAYLADDELGTAPGITGITEGGQNKPLNAKGPEDINKWCVRECERAWISPLSPHAQPDAEPELPDFSARRYNKAPHKRTSSDVHPAATHATELIDQVADSLSPRQARAVTRKLDTAQERELMEILRASSVLAKKEDA